MFFYVDESGHTGSNLFDVAQPRLYYGVLHSKFDLDVAAVKRVESLRKRLGVGRLHAAELGIRRLKESIPDLLELHFECDLFFDLYWIEKRDHAIICFFDQVFDQGMNPAVPWTGYWTPLRYVLLMKVAALFDEETAKQAWKARIDTRTSTATPTFLSVCQTLLERVPVLPDARSRELVGDALRWAIKNPQEIHYNCTSKNQVKDIAPNMIGFQSVMQGLSRRLAGSAGASRIVVDQQSQFNRSQNTLAGLFRILRDAPNLPSFGPGLPELEIANIPDAPLEFRAGADSIGLELVDVYLWIFRKVFDGSRLPDHFDVFVQTQLERGQFDQVSLAAIEKRWRPWFEQMPEPTPEDIAAASEIVQEQERRRKEAVANGA